MSRKRTDKRNRRESSNAQLMERSLGSAGRIRLQIYIKIKHPDTGLYVGYTGSSSTVDAQSVKEADHFVRSLRQSIFSLATKEGLSVPNSIIVKE